MKKFYLLLLLLAAITACKKSSAPILNNNVATTTNTTIQYQFVSISSASYQVTYTNYLGIPVDTAFTGTSFSKTVITNPSTGFAIAGYKMVCTSSLNTAIAGTATIYVNQQIATQTKVSLSSDSTNFYIYDIVFH